MKATFNHDLIYSGFPAFIGEIRMGKKATIIEVVFDTGSDWLVVPDINCSNCKGALVNSSISGTKVDTSLSTRSYGSA